MGTVSRELVNDKHQDLSDSIKQQLNHEPDPLALKKLVDWGTTSAQRNSSTNSTKSASGDEKSCTASAHSSVSGQGAVEYAFLPSKSLEDLPTGLGCEVVDVVPLRALSLRSLPDSSAESTSTPGSLILVDHQVIPPQSVSLCVAPFSRTMSQSRGRQGESSPGAQTHIPLQFTVGSPTPLTHARSSPIVTPTVSKFHEAVHVDDVQRSETIDAARRRFTDGWLDKKGGLDGTRRSDTGAFRVGGAASAFCEGVSSLEPLPGAPGMRDMTVGSVAGILATEGENSPTPQKLKRSASPPQTCAPRPVVQRWRAVEPASSVPQGSPLPRHGRLSFTTARNSMPNMTPRTSANFGSVLSKEEGRSPSPSLDSQDVVPRAAAPVRRGRTSPEAPRPMVRSSSTSPGRSHGKLRMKPGMMRCGFSPTPPLAFAHGVQLLNRRRAAV